jgi:hypothetical protein
MICAAYIVDKLFNRNRGLLIISVIILISSNYTTDFPRLDNWVLQFIQETQNPAYITPSSAIINFLKDKIHQDDLVFISPDYHIDTIMNYFDKKLRFINRISPDNLRILSQNKFLPQYVYNSQIAPDWLIFYGRREDLIHALPIPKNVNFNNYDLFVLPVYAYDQTTPEFFYHSFTPVKNFSSEDQVFIYRKRG